MENLLPKELALDVSKFISDKFLFIVEWLFGNIKGRHVLLYYALVTVIMLSSAELVTLFVRLLGGGKTFTKLFVDLCLFFVSYQIQNRVIFKKDKK